ncbi:UDP-glucuronosyltransferase 2B9-like [Sitophilus oryzae]|uniref:UDP-glucuronosyltransferase 2B9-like n=1 Tax=Sitophilus oryzae TaxID=7048 RepID=A0A6J2YGE9_SITOR|nr:UDP-glucuronosyltransferase 2B9-like [Sitophilus oryzae]
MLLKISPILKLILCFFIGHSYGANILGIIPSASFSHQLAYMKLWQELSLKGHHVTVLTTDPQRNASLVNLTEIDLSIGYQFIKEKYNWSKIIIDQTNPFTFLKQMLHMMYEATDLYLGLPEVRDLIHDRNKRFDLVMVEGIFPEWLIFGEIFNAPTVSLMSLEGTVQVHRMFQNPTNPVVYPEVYIPFVGQLNFKERLISTLLSWIFDYIKSQYTLRRQGVIDKHFGNMSVSIESLTSKPSLLFLCVNPILLIPRPYSPRTIVVGGMTIQDPNKLPQDVQEFLDSAKNGAILFSLGSNVKCEDLGEETVTSFLEVLSQLPYKVMWKFNNRENRIIPHNVKIYDWLFQQDILRHPNVKLFINQGGVQSLEEAIFFSVPLVGIPVYADQESNVKRLQLKGVLKRVSIKPRLDPKEFKNAILEVMSNQTYVDNMKRLNELWMDQPMNGIDKAIWWTEYVIRHKGEVDHMINKAEINTPFYQFYLLDIFGLIFILCFTLLSLTVFLCIRFLRCSFRIAAYLRQEHGQLQLTEKT